MPLVRNEVLRLSLIAREYRLAVQHQNRFISTNGAALRALSDQRRLVTTRAKALLNVITVDHEEFLKCTQQQQQQRNAQEEEQEQEQGVVTPQSVTRPFLCHKTIGINALKGYLNRIRETRMGFFTD